MPWFSHEADSIPRSEVEQMCQRLLDEAKTRLNIKEFKRVLLLPPDLTRAHAGVGWITETIYKLLPASCDTHVIPTLGQHVPHTEAENKWMFGSIPHSRIHAHDWRGGVTRVGVIPGALVKEKSAGAADWDIPVDLNTMTVTEKWDLIINIGHVVPHEVLGFANHNKNYFIGLGGKETICASHLAAATYGIENNLGKLITPLRACFNYAEDQFLGNLPDVYLQVVMQRDPHNKLVHSGVYVGDDLETYLMAAHRSRAQNVTTFDKPLKKVVAVMQADEFRRTWVANKAVYRTRMAIADGGELLIIAPGVNGFGEQPEVDAFIRKYGYQSTPNVMALYRQNADMQDLAHATAHLMHGTSEGRFTITYAPALLTKQEVNQVHYNYMALNEALERYNPAKMKEGFNTMPDGEEIFFISTPSAGLWSTKAKLAGR
ncbi:MAG TPA: lactate racemase domain-containing protein [Tepidisphaeraceae bacterium]|jgi:nickel-dependent lactate racemase|nr:lactate racemase domain-containing protein [Tepidisphaeraceae bacterium]